MINLIYGSTAVKPMTTPELLDLLAKSHIKNRRLNITGMLLYKGSNFLQVLEGDEKVVQDLYAVIKQDPRHHSVVTIATRKVSKRNFPDWEMGFMNLDSDEAKKIRGYTDYLQLPLDAAEFKDANFATTFLQVFKEGMR